MTPQNSGYNYCQGFESPLVRDKGNQAFCVSIFSVTERLLGGRKHLEQENAYNRRNVAIIVLQWTLANEHALETGVS